MAPFNPPDGVQVGGSVLRRIKDKACTSFLMPSQAPFALQILAELVRQRLEIVGVISRVTFHALSQRSQRPVRLLWTFLQLHPQAHLSQVAEAKLAHPKQPSSQHSIKYCLGHKFVVLAQQS